MLQMCIMHSWHSFSLSSHNRSRLLKRGRHDATWCGWRKPERESSTRCNMHSRLSSRASAVKPGLLLPYIFFIFRLKATFLFHAQLKTICLHCNETAQTPRTIQLTMNSIQPKPLRPPFQLTAPFIHAWEMIMMIKYGEKKRRLGCSSAGCYLSDECKRPVERERETFIVHKRPLASAFCLCVY